MPKRSPKVGKGPLTVAESATSEPDAVDEQGSFAFASCPVCGWRGPGRRSRERARKDLRHHLAADAAHPAAVVRDAPT